MATETNNFLLMRSLRSGDIEVAQSSFGPVGLGQWVRAVYSIYLAKGWQLGNWQLASGLLVALQQTTSQIVVATWLETVEEYGIGATPEEAIADLISSLGEYKESLGKRREQLGPSALRDLVCLQKLIERR